MSSMGTASNWAEPDVAHAGEVRGFELLDGDLPEDAG